jgi:hypothetical protein
LTRRHVVLAQPVQVNTAGSVLEIRFWACRRTGDFDRDILFSCRQPLAISGGIIYFFVASLAKRP